MKQPVITRALREVMPILRKDRSALILLFGLMLLNRMGVMVLPAAAKFVIDDVIGRRNSELFVPLALVIALALVMEGTTGFALFRLTGVISQRAATRLCVTLQTHVLHLPVRYFDDARNGTLLSQVMADPDKVRESLGPGVVQLATGLLTSVVALGVLFSLDTMLTVLVVTVLFAFLVVTTRGFGWLIPAFLQVSERTAEMTGRLAEVLDAIRVVKVYRAERREAHAFARESHWLLRDYVRAVSGAAGVVTAGTLAAGVVNGMLLVVGGKVVLAGGMTLGDFVMYVFFVGLLVTPLVQIAAAASQLGQSVAALARIAELRALATDADEDRGRASLPAVVGHVVFDDVSFSYIPGRPALQSVSFEVTPGMTMALAGPNGAGKTTVAELLLRFRHPNEGRVLVDNKDLAYVRGRDYRAHVGFVSHDAMLFEGTIVDNIRYARPAASSAEVLEAARLAHCEEFVSRLPEGYATLVGERGRRLSDGQRQRVAIARVFLSDPQILVLDEATAHLDLESDFLIQDALLTLRRGRTTLIIAHRLSTIRSAGQILMLEKGVIVERGTHEDLLAHQGQYWRLNEADDQRRDERYCPAGAVMNEGQVA